MNFSSINSITFSLTAIGYIFYFLVRHDWYAGTLYPITLGVFIVNVIFLVYSLFLLKNANSSTPNLKNQSISVYLKLVANVGFVLLMLIWDKLKNMKKFLHIFLFPLCILAGIGLFQLIFRIFGEGISFGYQVVIGVIVGVIMWISEAKLFIAVSRKFVKYGE